MGKNVFFRHGPVRLAKNKKYLEHANSTPFFWLADTWWYGATSRTPMSVFKTLVKKRKKQGFSAIQIVVGIPPETEVRGYSFNKDWSLNKEYFEEVDRKIVYLVENNIVPVIFGGWGHHIDKIGVANVKKLWHEIVARYASYPVVFCVSGEIDIELHKSRVMRFFSRVRRGSQNDNVKKRIKKWVEVGDYISKIDPFKRPITAHVSRKTTAFDLLGNKKWLSINTIQSGHSKASTPFMVSSILGNSKSGMPIINMEPWYEGILGNFGELEQRQAFWMCMLSGAKGHSYGAHGVWQMSKKGENFMKHWGDSDWQKSLGFVGAKQLGLAKKFLEKYEWWKLESCFEKITPHWSEDNAYFPLAGRIKNKHIFIYVPKVREVGEIGVKGMNKKAFYKALFILPKTMKIIDGFKFRGKEYIIPIQRGKTKDLIIVVSRA